MNKCRSSRPEVFCKKGVLRNFSKFSGKHLCQSLFIKKETLAQLFSCEFCEMNFAKFPRKPFLQNTSDVCFCKYKKDLVEIAAPAHIKIWQNLTSISVSYVKSQMANT